MPVSGALDQPKKPSFWRCQSFLILQKLSLMIESNYISSVKAQFSQYRALAEKAMAQVPGDMINWQYNEESNSIATIVKHMAGNMLSRFTDFYTSDGEKPWRDRDGEFEQEDLSHDAVMALWRKGWECFMGVLDSLRPEDLTRKVLIRREEHSVMEAINRQLTHYASHIGQIIFLSKMICGAEWNSLTIPKGQSRAFNQKLGL
jgi:hypothetical protein